MHAMLPQPLLANTQQKTVLYSSLSEAVQYGRQCQQSRTSISNIRPTADQRVAFWHCA